MESPIALGDTTAGAISQRLTSTHLAATTWTSQIYASVYAGEKVIQLVLKVSTAGAEVAALRRVQDSYINITQLLQLLWKLDFFSQAQLASFVNNEIGSLKYHAPTGDYTPEYNDLRQHANPMMKGVWVPFDRAVALAVKFDIYDCFKKLFLVDVHDYDELPKLADSKRPLDDTEPGAASPSKKIKLDPEADVLAKVLATTSHNSNFPFTLPVANAPSNADLVAEVKHKFGEIFKQNDKAELSVHVISEIFRPLVQNKAFEEIVSMCDIPLDPNGKTALHFASTLASLNLVEAFVTLGLNSPIRGTKTGESPLISTILVTNSMEKGNFGELLRKYLYPNLWLHDLNKWTFLHHLASNSSKKFESNKFYFSQIMTFILSNEHNNSQAYLNDLIERIVNLQEEKGGNTALHLAAENDSRWVVEMLLELQADINIENKTGLKPIDFDIVKEVINHRKLGILNEAFDDDDLYLLEVIRTNVEFLVKKLEIGGSKKIMEKEELVKTTLEPEKTPEDASSSTKIFNSIKDLLNNTNNEYENILNSKKQQVIELNQQLYDATLITANNKYLNKKIHDKLVHLDNLKLQMINLTEKLETLKNKAPENVITDNEIDENSKFDADEPFRIDELHQRLVSDKPIDDLESNQQFCNALPEPHILRARIEAYKELNSGLEEELNVLNDYSKLTTKFKKVVSFCTGVDINEVDELLDGLLEAVESQQ